MICLYRSEKKPVRSEVVWGHVFSERRREGERLRFGEVNMFRNRFLFAVLYATAEIIGVIWLPSGNLT